MAARKLARRQRENRNLGSSREGRETRDRRVTENRELTDSERLAAFQQSFFQSSLPDLPKIPGYHVCWLTTTNTRDSIAGRLRLGYELIKAADIPGWDYPTVKSSEYEGCISVNEMIAAKLPNHLYEMYMREAHYNSPLEQEERLHDAAEIAAESAGRAAKRRPKRPLVEFEPGTEGLGQAPPVPNFADH